MKYSWEKNSVVKTEIEKDSKEGDSFYIIANKEGFITLANILLEMAKEEIYDGYHMHLDEYNGLEKGSIELTLIKSKS
jgi:hypothetical protein